MSNNLKVFLANKTSGRLECNFDLKELTENFSLFKFINDARKNPSEDFGGFLVCTPKQYIFGYNSSFGTGTHSASFGRVMKDISGGGTISNQGELLSLSNKCERTYFCGRLLYECIGNNKFGRPIFSGGLAFLTAGSISPKMFETFKKFCEDYKKEIDLVISSSNGTCYLSYYNRELKNSIQTTDLNEVYNYVESHIDYDYEIDEDEVIIGVSSEKSMSI